jgi:hypothetical protein
MPQTRLVGSKSWYSTKLSSLGFKPVEHLVGAERYYVWQLDLVDVVNRWGFYRWDKTYILLPHLKQVELLYRMGLTSKARELVSSILEAEEV